MFQSALFALLWASAGGSSPADTYPRQPVDIEHYRFALTLADSTDRISGLATVRMRLLATDLSQIKLDLTKEAQGRGMTVTEVRVGDQPAAFTHADDRITITLARSTRAGDVVHVHVRYAGIPSEGLYIKPDKYGDRTFFSDNWPNRTHAWLPTIDHIADKATMEMDVTAPAHYQVISNGRRMEATDLAGGARRTVWHESVPIAPWLYALGVARFAVQHVEDYKGVPIETWVFAKDRDAGFHDFAVPTRDALAFYSEFVGPFAYEKLANVQSNSVSGGMEAASAIFYSSGSVSGTRPVRWRNVVIHEIAHQWFGNAVTENDWNDVWLSEGFATYFTLLFIEHAYGRDEFAAGLRSSRQTILDFYEKSPEYRVVHENLSDMSKVTTNMTYQKGSWTLHMLRSMMGDDRFWAGIREYYATYFNANASTADFRRVMERASGRDLGPFFDQWLYRGGVPRLAGTWRYDASAKAIVVDVRQTQSGATFSIPLEFGITSPGAVERIETRQLNEVSTTFSLPADVEPQDVVLDPRVRLLMGGRLERAR